MVRKRTEQAVRQNHPVMRMSLEQQFMVLAGALNRATQQGNTQAIDGLAKMLKGYEEKIAEQKQQAK
jgi:hypothetical protein